MVGNRIGMSGPFLAALGGDVSLSENSVTVEGTVTGNCISLSGTGRGSGSVQGQDFTCTGTSTAYGSRG